jgi:ribosomal protein S18 acetylase RimI-like enzyme
VSGLVSFSEGSSEVVAGWVTSAAEATRWAGLADWPVPPAVFAEWHAEPDVVPFLLIGDTGEPVGYGELWEDEAEAELARLVVDPEWRGRGNGRALVGALVTEARRRGFDEIWLRVVPDNETAIRCYHGAGFVRASPDEETEFNQGQGRTYLWLRHHETG